MANRYFLNIGANYNATANWSDTSGGTGGFSVPTNADDVFFDANSGNCTVNVASVAKSVNFTGYTNTITMTSTLTVSGSVTLVAAMTIAGASGLTINATGTFTSNGKTWPNALTFSATNTLTLADDLSVSGLLTTSGGITTVNGTFNINANGGITIGANLIQGTGTTTLNLLGGTWSGAGVIRINTNLNGNSTISGVVWFDTRTLTYISGSIITSGSTLRVLGNVTYNTGSVVWNNIIFDNVTYTLLSDLNISGNITTLGTATFNGTFNINSSGVFNINNTIQQGTGTTTLNLLGGTWSTTSANGILRINTNINGNITISGNVYYNTGTLTYTSGTVTTTGSTLNIGASTTLNTSGMSWNNVTFAGTNTITLLSDLNVNGLILVSVSNTTINGTFNINASGGITINTGFLTGTGTPTLNLLGGIWSGSSQVRINTNINGNITISGIVSFNSATLTYLSGTVTVSGSQLTLGVASITLSVTLNTSGMSWNNIHFNGTTTATLTSDLNIGGLLSINGSTTINGSFNTNINGGITLTAVAGNIIPGTGSPVLNLLNGIWSASAVAVIRLNTFINGNITISGNVYYNTGMLTYLSGKTNANTAALNVAASSTFINCDKINFKTIIITAATTQTFNRFFSGSALVPTRIQSTGANYTIAFQDGFEKITKFTKISNCTVSRPGQLLCITDKSNKGGNVGIRYINQSPNGIAKNAPTSPNPMAYGLPSFLDSDPNFIVG